ncbi:MAG: tyrosine-type recombinase/integrase, partial [Clostridium sp.]
SAARVQELIDLTIKSVRLEDPAVVILHGKGNKTRTVPIMKNTVLLLRGYLKEQNLTLNIVGNENPIFFNQQKQKLSRKGVSHILNKYVSSAKENSDFARQEKITCHVLRHLRAAHMIQAGIPSIYIRDFLGHSSVQSTEIYARLNNDIKRKAIESAYIDLNTPEYPSWDEDANLIDWLTNICK